MRSDKIFKWIIAVAGVIFLGLLLFWRYNLGISRYFDVDEFAHLHWGYSFLLGEKPYTDFFYLFPPFSLFPIAAIIKVFGRTVATIIAARIFIFVVFLLTSFTLFLLVKKLRNGLIALYSLCIFAFLPLPYDKMIEIRPDLFATSMAIGALYLFILAKETKRWIYFFLSGIFFSISLGLVPKTLFFLTPIAIIFIYDFYVTFRSKNARRFYNSYLLFAFGMVLPALILLWLIISWGKPEFALYSMTKMASDVTSTLGKKFYMRPDIFFYPNDIYYAFPGINQPLIVNLIIYLVAVLWGIWRFLASLAHQDNNKARREFVVSVAFLANLYAFIRIFPLKHAQYMIAFAPFVAFYFADFFWRTTYVLSSKLAKIFNNSWFKTLSPLLVFLFLFYIVYISKSMYDIKIKWVNTQSQSKLVNFLNTIPKDTAIFDLTGETVFFPNGYYFCCLPYGQYQEALGFNLPNIERDMAKRGTKYVYISYSDRLNAIPNMQAKYIRENFINFYPDGSMLIKNEE